MLITLLKGESILIGAYGCDEHVCYTYDEIASGSKHPESGSSWWVKMKGATCLTRRDVVSITLNTVTLGSWNNALCTPDSTFALRDITFIEEI